MTIVLLLAMITGVFQAIVAIYNARHGIGCARPINNPFTYIFRDKY